MSNNSKARNTNRSGSSSFEAENAYGTNRSNENGGCKKTDGKKNGGEQKDPDCSPNRNNTGENR